MTTTRMKLAVLLGVAAVGAMSVLADGGQVWYCTTYDSAYNDAFTKPAKWHLADKTPATAFSDEDVYISNNGLRLSQAPEFPGKALHLGSVSEGLTSSYILLYSGNIKTARDGLFLENGKITLNRAANSGHNLTGPVTVIAPATEPFRFNSNYTGCSLNITGSVTGDEGTGVLLGCSVAKLGFAFTDVSGYKGLIAVTSEVDAASSDMGVTLTLKNTSFPGGVDMGRKTALKTDGDAKGAEMSIGSMTLRAGSRIIIGGTATAHNIYRASKSVSAEEGVELVLDFEVPISYETNTLVLLSAPIGAADFTKDDFVLDASKSDWRQSYALDTVVADGVKSLVVVFEPLVIQIKTFSYEYEFRNNADYRPSSMDDPTHWSNNQVPQGGLRYSTKSNLRAPYDFSQPGVFPGSCLIVDGGAFRIFNDGYTVTNLTLRGATLEWGSGGTSPRHLVCDRLEILPGEDGAASSIGTYLGYGIVLDTELTGSGDLRFRGVNRSGMTTSPSGNYTLSKPSTNFFGAITVMQYDTTYLDFNSKFQTLKIADGRALGGKLEVFNPAALTLSRYSRLQVTDDATLDTTYNRGVMIDGCGRFFVDPDKTLVCDWPLTMNGAFHKEGKGRLELGGTVSFQGEDAIGDVPQANSNLFFVSAGTLVPRRHNCCDGLAMEFAKGTKLVIPIDPSNGDLAKYGLYNVKEGGSITIVDTLAVDFDLATCVEPPAQEFSVGILTVPKDAVGNVRGKLMVNKHPYPHFRAEIVEVPDDAHDAVIFTANVKQAGMLLLVR